MHLLYLSTSFCIPAEKKLFGCFRCWWLTRTTLISKHVFDPILNFPPTHKPFVDSWCCVHTEPTYDGEFPHVSLLPKETALRHVLRCCNFAKERSFLRPRCCHSTEGRALYCKWLNSSTGIVNTAQRASSSLSLSLSYSYHVIKNCLYFLIDPVHA